MSFLSIDQSTSSTTIFVFDNDLKIISKNSKKHEQFYTENGYVEHDADEIYNNLISIVKDLRKTIHEIPKFISITNQRETFVIFDKISGRPLRKAIVWQCRRGQKLCDELSKEEKNIKLIDSKTGLKLDTYFPASKLKWLFDNDENIKNKVEKGEALFGTIDTYLLYRLTNGNEYATDVTNASRTLLFNCNTLNWDNELKALFNLDKINLPVIKESGSKFGKTNFEKIFDREISIHGVIGDAQGSFFSTQCFDIADTRINLGTGSNILTNIGSSLKNSDNALTTLSYVYQGNKMFAYECLNSFAGATISWLENNLKIINNPEETEKISSEIPDSGGVYLIPAFVGLSAPYWLPHAKAMYYGISASTNYKHLVRASLESVAYQIVVYLEYLRDLENINISKIIIEGGMTDNHFLIQLIANLTNKEIKIPLFADMSVYGSLLKGLLSSGMCKNFNDLKKYTVKTKSFFPIKDDKSYKDFKIWKEIIDKHYIRVQNN